MSEAQIAVLARAAAACRGDILLISTAALHFQQIKPKGNNYE